MTEREQLKKRLKRYRANRAEICQIKKEIAWIEENLDGLHAANLDGTPRGSGVSDPTYQAYARQEALKARYIDQLARLSDEQAAIEDMIAALEPTERKLMRCYYMEGLTWEEVCVAISYGWTRTHELHGHALDKLLARKQ